MSARITHYFRDTIHPLIAAHYPDVAANMNVLIAGSVGMGADDEGSDLDAHIYLEDPLWREQGGQVQLLLDLHAPPFNKPPVGHPPIVVHPLSWLLDGQAPAFLAGAGPLPWEEVNIESLFELQENVVPVDAEDRLARLQATTAPANYPDWLWRKQLLTRLNDLLSTDDLSELARVVEQGKYLEAQIILGTVLQSLLELGFVMEQRYYPYRKHLSWAFARLPVATLVGDDFSRIAHTDDWTLKAAAVSRIKEAYKRTLLAREILSPALLAELGWACRLEAWTNPDWHDRPVACRQQAEAAGYGTNASYIWSLWGWVERGAPANLPPRADD